MLLTSKLDEVVCTCQRFLTSEATRLPCKFRVQFFDNFLPCCTRVEGGVAQRLAITNYMWQGSALHPTPLPKVLITQHVGGYHATAVLLYIHPTNLGAKPAELTRQKH